MVRDDWESRLNPQYAPMTSGRSADGQSYPQRRLDCSAKMAATLLSSIEHASKLMETYMKAENAFNSLSNGLRIDLKGAASVSGLSDVDYPAVDSSSTPQLHQQCTIAPQPTPGEILELFKHLSTHYSMGLFTEINRAWLALDSDLYMWTYDGPHDVVCFNALNETIVAVGLVKPNEKAFHDLIKHLICIATTTEVVLVGVCFTASPGIDVPGQVGQQKITLHHEPLFATSTDGVLMHSIIGTDIGRIFLGGADGCLYELEYGSISTWFGQTCKLVNHSRSSFSFLLPTFIKSQYYPEDAVVELAVDCTRNILYSRTSKDDLRVFDLGIDGSSLSEVALMNQSGIVRQATNSAKTVDKLLFRTIKSISPISARECAVVHLEALTEAGVRLFFTTATTGLIHSRPTTLQLVHIRLPTGYAANTPQNRPQNVKKGLYKQGNTIMVSSPTASKNILWMLSRDPFPFSALLKEDLMFLPVDGDIRYSEEEKQPEVMPHILTLPGDAPPELQFFPPLVVMQHLVFPRKYVLLSMNGVIVVSKLRPVDVLKNLLMTRTGLDNELVKKYFELHNPEQACATALVLASSQDPQNVEAAERARRAIFLFGGEPRVNTVMSSGEMRGEVQITSTPYTSTPIDSSHSQFGQYGSVRMPGTPVHPSQLHQGLTPAAHMQSGHTPSPGNYGAQVYTPYSQSATPNFYSSRQSPQSPSNQPYSPQMPVQSSNQTAYMMPSNEFPSASNTSKLISMSTKLPSVSFSSRHNGMYIYFGRLLRPIWYSKIAEAFKQSQEEVYFVSTMDIDQIDFQILQLSSFVKFIENNKNFLFRPSQVRMNADSLNLIGGATDLSLTTASHGHLQYREAEVAEEESLMALSKFADYTRQVLGLWKILLIHQFHVVTDMLNPDRKMELKSFTFQDLFLKGQDLCSSLIAALVDMYIKDKASVDPINSKLREVCPLVYRSEDSVCAKINELLMQAKMEQNIMERSQILQSVLGMSRDVACEVNIASICQELYSVHFYRGIVDLCLVAAKKRDPCQKGWTFYRSGKPQQDIEGSRAYHARMECYNCLIAVLYKLLSMSADAPGSLMPPPVQLHLSHDDSNELHQGNSLQAAQQMFSLILDSEDELCHMALYNWLLESKLYEELLGIIKPSLESFLLEVCESQGFNVEAYDVLWKFYERRKQYSSAAKIQEKLACATTNEYDLNRRLQYLTRAILCLKTEEGGRLPQHGEFLFQLEEKKDVALVQLMVLESLKQIKDNNPRRLAAVSELDSSLMNISKLYEDFAEPFNLTECKLSILHCAGVKDQTMIKGLWKAIIEDELCRNNNIPKESIMTSVLLKVEALVQKYRKTPTYCPLEFILSVLELEYCNLGMASCTVADMFLQSGVPLPELLESYYSVFRERGSQWTAMQKEFYLVEVMAHIVSRSIDNPSLVKQNERRRFIVRCQDLVTEWLSLVSSKPRMESLMQTLRGLIDKLDRM